MNSTMLEDYLEMFADRYGISVHIVTPNPFRFRGVEYEHQVSPRRFCIALGSGGIRIFAADVDQMEAGNFFDLQVPFPRPSDPPSHYNPPSPKPFCEQRIIAWEFLLIKDFLQPVKVYLNLLVRLDLLEPSESETHIDESKAHIDDYFLHVRSLEAYLEVRPPIPMFREPTADVWTMYLFLRENSVKDSYKAKTLEWGLALLGRKFDELLRQPADYGTNRVQQGQLTWFFWLHKALEASWRRNQTPDARHENQDSTVFQQEGWDSQTYGYGDASVEGFEGSWDENESKQNTTTAEWQSTTNFDDGGALGWQNDSQEGGTEDNNGGWWSEDAEGQSHDADPVDGGREKKSNPMDTHPDKDQAADSSEYGNEDTSEVVEKTQDEPAGMDSGK
ncbi:hypothetical protein K505DRAFT_359935 [Melanomma pulvis-pyrius CBS 109.77]|uniref:Uncharacterized protein n=1 Tax=Melanomma pulvis-pyrius CBS 109.77 TaxID=1314802 RepID=A0A6A6XH67_9PLEO|nr:hypothetical protein K505DRAFT_359935 [Melanomma pulvis-pyrius CBS 109.77]